MNPPARDIMRAALGAISAIDKPASDPVKAYEPEALLEKLDFPGSTVRNTLEAATLPGESRN